MLCYITKRLDSKWREWRRRAKELAGDEGVAPVRGFMCVAGGFLIQLTLGSYYSFANMMPYMVSYMRQHSEGEAGRDLTYADFIVVQSAWGITQGIVLPVAGALAGVIGVCKAVLLGSLMFAAAPALTSLTLSTNLMNVVLSFGVLSAIGQNLAILPTLTLPMAWFPHRRGLVAGIVVSGFGFGAFFFNQLQTSLANPGDLPVARNGTHEGYFDSEEVLGRVPGLLRILAATYGGLLLLGAALLLQDAPPSRQCRLGVEQMCERVAVVAAGPLGERGSVFGHSDFMSKRNQKLRKTKSSKRSGIEEGGGDGEGCCVGVGRSLLRLRPPSSFPLGAFLREFCGRDSSLRRVLRYRETYLLWLTRFGVVLISQGLSGLYKAFALEELGYQDDFLARVGAIAGIFNCLGRLSFGVLVDKVSYKALMCAEAVVMLALIAPFYWISALNRWAFAAALWACYFCISGTFAMHPALCGRIYGPWLQFVAIGLVGSSDIVNNLLIGLLSSTVLGSVGWSGYFVCLSSLCVLVLAVTLAFPAKNIRIQSLKEYQAERARKALEEREAVAKAAAAVEAALGQRNVGLEEEKEEEEEEERQGDGGPGTREEGTTASS